MYDHETVPEICHPQVHAVVRPGVTFRNLGRRYTVLQPCTDPNAPNDYWDVADVESGECSAADTQTIYEARAGRSIDLAGQIIDEAEAA